MAAYVKILPISSINQTEILPLWQNLLSVLDKNFYLKDTYTYPLVGAPLLMTGECSEDVHGVEIYRGQIHTDDPTRGRGSTPAEKIASLTWGGSATSFDFYLPPCYPGDITLEVRAYNGANAQIARNHFSFVMTNYATMLWGYYVELAKDQEKLNRLRYPFLAQDKTLIPDLVDNYLPVTKIEQAEEWPNLNAARAYLRMALQGLYGHALTPKGLRDYATAQTGSLAVHRDPDGWILGADWEVFHREATLSAAVGSAYQCTTPIRAYSIRSSTYNSSVSASAAHADYFNTSPGSGIIYIDSVQDFHPGSVVRAEVDVLSNSFNDGDYLALAIPSSSSLAFSKVTPELEENYLEVRTTCLSTTSSASNAYYYTLISSFPYVFQVGDYLEYDVYLPDNGTPSASGGYKMAVDITSGGYSCRDSIGWVDQNGVSGHPSADLAAYAKDKWYHRVLKIPTRMIGMTAGFPTGGVYLGSESQALATVTGRFRRIRVTRNGKVAWSIYNGELKFPEPRYGYRNADFSEAVTAGETRLDYCRIYPGLPGYPEGMTVITETKIEYGTHFVTGATAGDTADNIRNAWNTYVATSATYPLSAVTAIITGGVGRIWFESTSGSGALNGYVLLKGGAIPERTPIRVVMSHLDGGSDPDQVVVDVATTPGDATPHSDYHSYFLGGGPRDFSVTPTEGTVSFYGNSRKYWNSGELLQASDRWDMKSHYVYREIPLGDFTLASSSDFAPVGHWYVTIPDPIHEISEYDADVTPTFYPPNVLGFGALPTFVMSGSAPTYAYSESALAVSVDDSRGTNTGVPYAYYTDTTYPVSSVVSVNGSGAYLQVTTNASGDQVRVILGMVTTPGATADLEYYRKPYSVTYRRLPVLEVSEGLSRTSGSFFGIRGWVEPPQRESSSVKSGYSFALTDFASSGEITWVSTGLESHEGVWTRTKASKLLRDMPCYANILYVESGVFAVNDVITFGRDQAKVTAVTTIPYYGDKLTINCSGYPTSETTTKERHYAGEPVFVDQTLVLELSTPMDLWYPMSGVSSGRFFPPSSRVILDYVAAAFNDSEHTVYIKYSDNNSSWTSWEEFPYPYEVRPAPVDSIGGSAYLSSAYQQWQAGPSYTSPTFVASSVSGAYKDGCILVDTASAYDQSKGVYKTLPRGGYFDHTICFYANGYTSQASGHIGVSTDIYVASSNFYSPTVPVASATFVPAVSSWGKITLSGSSLLPAQSDLSDIRTLVFYSANAASNYYVDTLYNREVYRYFKFKVEITGTRGKKDYTVLHTGVKSVTDPRVQLRYTPA